MFEPQDHPNDFKVSPVRTTHSRPYDIAGWTLALQMGVQFDRILDGFDGPFAKIPGPMLDPPASNLFQNVPQISAGYLISHRENDSFILINRLLKAKCDVYWSGSSQPMANIWVRARLFPPRLRGRHSGNRCETTGHRGSGSGEDAG